MQIVVRYPESKTPVRMLSEEGMTDDEFYDFCQDNPDLRIERSARGEITVMPGTGGETGYRNANLTSQLVVWAEPDGRGVVFDSSTEFRLPSGAVRMADAAWVERARLASLTREQKRKFPPLCPDFVVELTSPSDRLPDVQEKMGEWTENGARLGWLIDADARTAYIYRPGLAIETLIAPEKLVGEGPVDGFVLDLAVIWDPAL
jgi:Uma2 family endonuclease